MEFTIRELEILTEGVKAWKNRDVAGEIVTDLLMNFIMCKDEKIKQEFLEMKKKEKNDKKLRKEREEVEAAMLIAKILSMKQKMFEETVKEGSV